MSKNCHLLDPTIKNFTDDEDNDDDFWLKVLKGACEYANGEFVKEQENIDTSKIKICNLCRHYSLMNLKCQKKDEHKTIKDTCVDWQEA